MFCNRCGQELPNESQFCNKCGQKFGVPPIPSYASGNMAPTGDMTLHLQIVAWFNIVFGAIGIFIGLGVFGLFSVLGVSIPYLSHLNNEASNFPFGLFFSGLGIFILAILTILSLPQLIGGIGVLKRRNWGRIVIIIVSIFGLFQFPFGTILGAYSLWVLFSRGGEMLFHSPSQ